MKIERQLMVDLNRWKDLEGRKPLVLEGVRQCGKTWLLKEFGARYFDDTVYFNFENEEELSAFFDGNIDPSRILYQLGIFAGRKLHPQKTLIIFDEIQKCPKALNALKYFCEKTPQYPLVAAGSLLGITLSAEVGFPVGKVNFLELYPCSFSEYLAVAAPALADYCKTVTLAEAVPLPFCVQLESHFRDYCAFGGMPEVISGFLPERDTQRAEQALDDILKSYERDFAKHAPAREIPKLFLLWKSIPLQLGRENVKFIYGEVRDGARAKDLEDALRWLTEAGMVYRVHNVATPALPLTAYEDRRNFKLYLNDCGLLRKLTRMSASTVVNQPDLWNAFRGRFVENFVLQELKSLHINPVCYWTGSATAEVDFLIQNDSGVIPVEVKSGLNTASKSLKIYRQKYSPALSVRCSLQNLKKDDGLLNVPLYLIGELQRFIR